MQQCELKDILIAVQVMELLFHAIPKCMSLQFESAMIESPVSCGVDSSVVEAVKIEHVSV